MANVGFGSCCGWAAFLGGHSLFSRISAAAVSPFVLVCETTLELREEAEMDPDSELRFVWVSNRPIRLATLPRADSSGRGLKDKDRGQRVPRTSGKTVVRRVHFGVRGCC
jgi:hypothetical protein